jgi:hypothetical protein
MYGDLLREDVLSGINLVGGGLQKALYAGEGRLLIDDSPHVVQAFQDEGGSAFLWDERESLRNIEILLSNLPRGR